MSCDNTNRLCIDSENLIIGKNEVYFPITLIPREERNQLKLALVNGTISDAKYQCIEENGIQVEPQVINEFIAKFTVELNSPAGIYHLELSNNEKSQCILGPSIRGKYAESVELVNGPIATPTDIVTPTITIQPTFVNEESSWVKNNYLCLIIAGMGLTIVLLLIILIIRCTKEQLRSQEQKRAEPIIVEVDTTPECEEYYVGDEVIASGENTEINLADQLISIPCDEIDDIQFFSCESGTSQSDNRCSLSTSSASQAFYSCESSNGKKQEAAGSFQTAEYLTSDSELLESDLESNIWENDSTTSTSTVKRAAF